MRLKEALHQASKALRSHSIDDAPLEAELLVMHLLGLDRAQLYSRLEEELSPHDGEALEQLLRRRLWREPLAYILGRREFFGRDFHVARGVLIPRPESELLVERALDLVKGEFAKGDPIIAEIGTGCGAIAISLALELPGAKIYATDISPRALEIAAINCHQHGVAARLCLLEGDLLEPLPEAVDILVANPPYVRDEDIAKLSPEIRMFEPMEALAGGSDGLDKVRQILGQAKGKLRRRGSILLEIGAGQGREAATLAGSLFPEGKVELARDLAGWERVLGVRLP